MEVSRLRRLQAQLAPESTAADASKGYDAKISELQLVLPPPPKPLGRYKPGVLVGNLWYFSGAGPVQVGNFVVFIFDDRSDSAFCSPMDS